MEGVDTPPHSTPHPEGGAGRTAVAAAAPEVRDGLRNWEHFYVNLMF